ncbi:hypothetical protein MMC12_006289 [Toensbergia leucococca]|nr:hypothetical protein [Toensbergia leucococca]
MGDTTTSFPSSRRIDSPYRHLTHTSTDSSLPPFHPTDETQTYRLTKTRSITQHLSLISPNTLLPTPIYDITLSANGGLFGQKPNMAITRVTSTTKPSKAPTDKVAAVTFESYGYGTDITFTSKPYPLKIVLEDTACSRYATTIDETEMCWYQGPSRTHIKLIERLSGECWAMFSLHEGPPADTDKKGESTIGMLELWKEIEDVAVLDRVLVSGLAVVERQRRVKVNMRNTSPSTYMPSILAFETRGQFLTN